MRVAPPSGGGPAGSAGSVGLAGSLRQPTHRRFPITEQADVGTVRRTMSRYADGLPVARHRLGAAELVATELATNLLRHADPGGWILARLVPPATIELVAVDRGPGIADLAAAVEGRTPAPGGLGCGLAAVRRSASYFDVHTAPGLGTVVLALVDLVDPADPGAGPAPGRCRPRRWAGVSLGLVEECGDGWAVADPIAGPDRGSAVIVVDGLGHGERASAATDAAVAAFAAAPAHLDGFVRRANEAMRFTRGAAAAACVLDPDGGELRYVVVGNVAGRVVTGNQERGLVSSSGTLGLRRSPPPARVISTPWPAGAVLVLWTDGLSSRVHVRPGAELLDHDPVVVAAALHREYGRDRDDATVVVVRNPAPP